MKITLKMLNIKIIIFIYFCLFFYHLFTKNCTKLHIHSIEVSLFKFTVKCKFEIK